MPGVSIFLHAVIGSYRSDGTAVCIRPHIRCPSAWSPFNDFGDHGRAHQTGEDLKKLEKTHEYRGCIKTLPAGPECRK